MLQLIETICYENGAFHRIPLHEERMNRSRRHFLGVCAPIFLSQFLKAPENVKGEKLRCRITYTDEIENIEYESYIFKKIESLKLVEGSAIDYSFKYKNRDSLNLLLEDRGNQDEILIVRNGYITDTSFTNIVLLQNGYWYTPALPILTGTRRAEYLFQRKIFPRNIRPGELKYYEEARLINSMRSMKESAPIRIKDIY
ncbi:MAG: aminotransferase class IV [Prolixibacteraceae bacterium]|jgi:4-amino-4-deoxychorismate lyase|nr:aminotransferase class IV [Prolixibacteraceae bacterium]